MDTYKDNALYHLIRQKAGTKMLREAEQVNVYNWLSELFAMADNGDDTLGEASKQIQAFMKDYPVLPEDQEVPMQNISLSEVVQMDPQELERLPWIYVDMLRTLSADDPEGSWLLDEKLNSSHAVEWRLPLEPGVTNKDAFEYVYTIWYQDNQEHVEESNSWAFGTRSYEYSSYEFSMLQKARFEKVQARVKQRIAEAEDLQATVDGNASHGGSTRGGGCGCGMGSVETCDCNGEAPASNFVVPPTAPINLLFAAFDRAKIKKQIRDLEWGGEPYEYPADGDMTCGGGEGPPPDAHLPLPASPISQSEEDYEDMPPLESL